MRQSESITKIASAIVKAQGELNAVSKDGTNPHFRSKYATLQNIVESCRDTLRKHGLAVVQTFAETDGTYINLDTTLLHESGEWIAGTFTMTPTKHDPQGMGSATTYARRYALSAILGIVTDDDDDGNASSQPTGDRASQAKYGSVASDDDKAWLNACDKQGNLTEKGYETAKFLFENPERSIADVRKKYKVSKSDEAAIMDAMAEMKEVIK
jgi:hypothetical protein